MNDVVGIGGRRFCDNSNKASAIESATRGEGAKKCSKLCDVIYGRPLDAIFLSHEKYFLSFHLSCALVETIYFTNTIQTNSVIAIKVFL
jgi:hypothetical protein